MKWATMTALVFASFFGLQPARAAALELWELYADPRLPEKARQGLILWLDAGCQDTARWLLGKERRLHQQPLDIWFDSSPKYHHVVQKKADRQPRWQILDKAATVRFDGLDDFLALDKLDLAYRELTVFVVAAPFSNFGDFRAFLAGNPASKNDYNTGFNIDLGAGGSSRWQQVNIEGAGNHGMNNLLGQPVDFGQLQVLTALIGVGKDGIKLYRQGKLVGQKKRAESTMHLQHLTIGARMYSNEPPRPPYVRGFLDGDIAEILIYDHLLSEAERQTVEKYLMERYKGVTLPPPPHGPQGPGTRRLVTVADPPPVQVLVPGFAVKQLPLDLPNINNLRYRRDGKLVALAYNGDVYLLSDTDGDGLEDRVELFWQNKDRVKAPIGMTLTPPNYHLGNGLFFACKGKVMLVVDTDGDDRADKEIVVAEGWQPLPYAHGVDALGVALDKEGNVYFGLGTTNYANGYLLDKDGRAHYDLKNERGTIMKVSPDFKNRQILSTGIRFPVGLAFNRHGDLFATDQEGATWLPNGNPFDELLHIQPGRHYGFPPRHPKHLSGVIDEPSVVDYGPQHQSTCGLQFNEPMSDGPVFGPKWWQGDALVCGESRGKLFRTQLLKTDCGYVAKNHQLARLNMLTVDSCVSPKGELVVAVHSGPPDWGTGPAGKGKLYKIIYDNQPPQPLLAWAAGPGEVRIAFDRPLDPNRLRNLTKQVQIEYGPYVTAGDRFEVLHPPYAVVQQQLRSPRYEVPVLSTALSAERFWLPKPGRRTLIIKTAPMREALSYALTLPGLGRPAKPGAGELPQHSAIDLDFNLGGVAASWQRDKGESWTGWLPHVDLEVCHRLTQHSEEHEGLRQVLSKPGKLRLTTQLDLWQMLRPAVQPGSTLDHTWPPEQVTVTLSSPNLLAVKAAGATVNREGPKLVRIKTTPKEGAPLPLELVMATGDESATLKIWFNTNEDSRHRAIPLQRFLLPWARQGRSTLLASGPRVIPEIAGGSWAKGRDVFFGDKAMCSRCHLIRGQGGKFGPDLSNLIHRDYDSVLRDIRFPSASINPDYLASVVLLRDGRVLSGILVPEGDRYLLGDNQGKEHAFPKKEVEAMTTGAISVMPEGLDKGLSQEELRDLLTFLLTEPLTPAPLERAGAPAPRSRAELAAVLKDSKPLRRPLRPLHVVLAAGPKDHGPGEHDYPLWQRRWLNLLGQAEGVTVGEARGWPTPRHFAKADVIVFYSNNPGWSAEKAKELDAFLQRGGGLVYIHYAVDGHKAGEALAQRIGLAWRGGYSRFRHGALELSFPDAKHPITRGFAKVRFIDESYWRLVGDPDKIHVLATGMEEGEAQPLLWAKDHGKGRVFVSILGHYTWTFDDPLFRLLVLRGLLWSTGENVDRFNDLAAIGARLGEK